MPTAKKYVDDLYLFTDETVVHKPLNGFLIKKDLWGGRNTTNFIFKVDGFKGDIVKINSIKSKNKVRDRIRAIQADGGILSFGSLANDQFAENLKDIDTAFSKFIAKMLLNFFTGNESTVAGLVDFLVRDKDLSDEFGLSLSVYKFKMKNFLDAIALGMIPSVEWDGFMKAQGGYIVVKRNGEVVCYHLYNRDEFREYLYENTKFESGSTAKHDYGKLYAKNNELFFNLNLQIRFKK